MPNRSAVSPRSSRGKDFISLMARLGRGTDDTVGHLTTGEVVIPRNVIDQNPQVLVPFIKAMTEAGEDWRRFVVGQGKRNPRTGAQEFLSLFDHDVEVSDWASGAPGTGLGRETEDRPSGGGLSIGSVTPGSWSRAAAPSYSEGGPLGSAGSRTAVTGMDTPASLEAEGIDPYAPDDRSLFDRILGAAIGDTGAPSGSSAGMLGSIYSQMLGPLSPLMAVGRVFQELGGVVDWEPGNPNPGAVYRDESSEDYRSPWSQKVNQIANAAVAAGLIEPPAWLKRSVEGLSPLQQRAHIATRGTAGGDSAYRGRDAFDYYRSLVTNSGPDYAGVLPVEHQYLKDIWGANYEPTTTALLKAIAEV